MGHSDSKIFQAVTDLKLMSEVDLAAEHIQIKEQIALYQGQLDAVNAELAGRLEHPEEGSKTHKVANMKVKVSGRVYRRLDRAVWLQIRDNFNPAIRPVKDDLDESAWKKLQKENPEVAARIAPAIVCTAGKPGIEISF